MNIYNRPTHVAVAGKRAAFVRKSANFWHDSADAHLAYTVYTYATDNTTFDDVAEFSTFRAAMYAARRYARIA